MRYLIIIVFLLTSAFGLPAQPFYPVLDIPKNLLQNADVVVRKYELTFQVLNKGEAIETEHMVLTLLNEKAASQSEPVFYYDKFVKIQDIEASVYDSEGKLVRHLKKKDIEDGKPLEYYVYDHRYKILRLPGRSYPYTIEYTVIKKHEGLMFYPEFEPQMRPSASVEYASFEVIMPAGLEARFKEVNLPMGCKTGPMRWELKNIAAFRAEPYAPANNLSLPRILSAPTDFTFGDVDGDMRTWESYGEFLEKLIKPQTDISLETRAKLQEMVADCPDMECKIRRVYDYLQSNTRYFYVGFGIGGWQPAPASQVDQFKYGDCKGLSNYMAVMLNTVGMPAFCAIIRAGEDEQMTQFPDFPNAWFNHLIVCVLMEKDTFWLECTSQTESCGFLGSFTDNRPALVVTPTGGKLIQTPKYDETKNTIRRETRILLQPDGSATLQSRDVYGGISQKIPAILEGYHDEIRKEYFYKTLNVSDFEIKSLEFKRNKDRLPSVEQNLVLALPRLASSSGKRLFLPMSLLSTKLEVPTTEGSRRFEVQPDSRGFTEEDFVTVSIPKGYHLESQFEPIVVSTEFGSFEVSVKYENSQIFIHRKLILNAVIRPKETFPEFVAFSKAISKADKTKLVLLKDE